MASETKNTNLCRIILTIVVLTILLTGCSSIKHTEIDTPEAARELVVEELEINESESYINLLREVMLDNELVYVFEIVAKERGAAALAFVRSNTGQVYSNSEKLFLDHLETSSKDQYIAENYLGADIYYLEMHSTDDPEQIQWYTYVVNKDGYTNIEDAKQAIVKDYIDNDPLLSLLGKEVDEIENITGEKAAEITVADVDEIEDITSLQLAYEGVEIYFFNRKIADQIFFKEGQKLLGVNVSDTFDQIKAILGEPESCGPDPYFPDVYTMTYYFDNICVEFYAKSLNGKTVSALAKLT
ncbi:MAG: hypothetical protein GX922_04380 [Firmicutes bacterium]|nr:hypothetical protein [Bacillota bacterium]